MPKYAALIYTSAKDQGTGTPDEWAQIIAEYNEFGEAAGAAGVILGGEALHDTDSATTIHVEGGRGGNVTTTMALLRKRRKCSGGSTYSSAPIWMTH